MKAHIINPYELKNFPPSIPIYGSKGGKFVQCSRFQRGTLLELLKIVRNDGKFLDRKAKNHLYEAIMQLHMSKEIFEEIESTLGITKKKCFPTVCFHCGSNMVMTITPPHSNNRNVKEYMACYDCNTVIREIAPDEE